MPAVKSKLVVQKEAFRPLVHLGKALKWTAPRKKILSRKITHNFKSCLYQKLRKYNINALNINARHTQGQKMRKEGKKKKNIKKHGEMAMLLQHSYRITKNLKKWKKIINNYYKTSRDHVKIWWNSEQLIGTEESSESNEFRRKKRGLYRQLYCWNLPWHTSALEDWVFSLLPMLSSFIV